MTCAPVGAVAANSEGVTHRVLAIHSYSQDYPWTSGQHSSFIQTLENGLPNAPTVKTEYLDTKRKALDDTYSEEFVRYLRVKYQEFAPDAIYVTDDNALNFSLGPLANLYPNVPIFFSGVNDFSHLGHIDQKRGACQLNLSRPCRNSKPERLTLSSSRNAIPSLLGCGKLVAYDER